MPKLRGCFFWSGQAAIGCTGMLFGATLTLGAQALLVVMILAKAVNLIEEARSSAPSRDTYNALCTESRRSNSRDMREICEAMHRRIVETEKQNGSTRKD